jgi:hypothetical protein
MLYCGQPTIAPRIRPSRRMMPKTLVEISDAFMCGSLLVDCGKVD